MERCTVEGCERAVDRGEFCRAHYEQARRAKAGGKRVRFKTPRTSPGEGGRVFLRIPAAELEKVALRAEGAGVSVAEWLREAVRMRLRGTL